MTWRITHFNAHGHRHCLLVDSGTRDSAIALAESLYGEALHLRAIRLPRTA